MAKEEMINLAKKVDKTVVHGAQAVEPYIPKILHGAWTAAKFAFHALCFLGAGSSRTSDDEYNALMLASVMASINGWF